MQLSRKERTAVHLRVLIVIGLFCRTFTIGSGRVNPKPSLSLTLLTLFIELTDFIANYAKCNGCE